MKKLFILFAAVILVTGFSSCKKDYTCTCTFNNGNPTIVLPFNGATHKDAKESCDAAAATYAVAGGTGCTLK